ncbi:FAD-dependent oxidoreductase [Bacillus sp. REN10]|uniref:phytoene desaturase family protein n=1 Tax=Bacillus sp. REN10 TaxID=2782541 RepID=UPI00193BFAD8|nr:FAD-dependent oxidoreductase [Bacillus sp. REN10]
MSKRVMVVGAGIAGLTAASLLAKVGYQVTVLEASSELGGCAGKFQRHQFLYPAGATLGMGLEPNGIHERVFRFLQKPFPIEPLEVVMEMIHPTHTFTFYRDRIRHVEQMQAQFPQEAKRIEAFYQEVFETARIVRTLMQRLPILPPTTVREWGYLMASIRPVHVKLLPDFNRTLHDVLKKHSLHTLRPFVHMLDGLLIDSMQTGSRDVSYLLAAVALDIYHEGAFYVPGGLYRLAEMMGESVVENGGTIKKRRTVTKVVPSDNGWLVHDHRDQSYEADFVILNSAIQQLPQLLEPKLVQQLKKTLKRHVNEPTWVTLTLYITVNVQKLSQPLPLFRQISTSHNGNMAEGEHFFMSASALGDHRRAPDDYQTITISTHSNPAYWATKEKYDHYRATLAEKMLTAVEVVVPSFREAIESIEYGAPKAWENYTKRPNGYVGGFPQTVAHALFRSISHRSGLNNLYLCGDHIFPGGGTIGAATSGIHVARSIAKSRLV